MKNTLFYLNLILVFIFLFISCRNKDVDSSLDINSSYINDPYYQNESFSFKYIHNDGYYLNEIYTEDHQIIIPEKINNQPVVGILNQAFFNKINITSITIPSSIKYIEEYSFYHLPSLTYHFFQNGLYLGNQDNPYLVLVDVKDKTQPLFIVHPDTKIILDAFINYQNLETINLPTSLSSIQFDAFFDCENLKFNHYQNGLYLGNELNPYYVLVTVNDKSIKNFSIHINTHFILNSFYLCENLKEISIPSQVISIGKYAFYSCKNLEHVLLNENLSTLGAYAFLDCHKLLTIQIPKLIKILPIGLLANCNELSSIELPLNLKVIENYVFSSCKNLKEINLPSNMNSIAKEAFYGCDNLKLYFSTPLPFEHYITYWENNNIVCNINE